MLGTLAKWLRIFGFDTFYANSEIDDNKLLEISKNENRILLTRDKNLIFRARRENIQTIEINMTDINEQISYVLNNYHYKSFQVLSRCILCNTLVIEIDKNKIRDKVPPKVFENNNKFWYCKNCKKIYWKGSHYNKMMEKINNLD